MRVTFVCAFVYQSRARTDQLANEITLMDSVIDELLAELRDKRSKGSSLHDELARMPKHVPRAQYTTRIIDIISSLAKQDGEIERVVQDIKAVKKAINSAGKALTRADIVAEDKIFRVANAAHKDPLMVQAYKLLTAMRAFFTELFEAVDSGSELDQESRSIALKIEQEKGRMAANNELIYEDIEQLKVENASLARMLRDASC